MKRILKAIATSLLATCFVFLISFVGLTFALGSEVDQEIVNAGVFLAVSTLAGLGYVYSIRDMGLRPHLMHNILAVLMLGFGFIGSLVLDSIYVSVVSIFGTYVSIFHKHVH